MSEPLWQPSASRVANAQMTAFMHKASSSAGRELNSYADLYQWSIDDISGFWRTLWEYAGIIASQAPAEVLIDGDKMPGARWFDGARLNFAENLLRRDDDEVAIVFSSELTIERQLTFVQLRQQVAALAARFRELGIKPGDRVAGLMPNMPETVVSMLAATSIGAVWSSCSPDFGTGGITDRFGQIEPRILVSTDWYQYKGKKIPLAERLHELKQLIPAIEHVLLVPFDGARVQDADAVGEYLDYRDIVSDHSAELQFEQLPFDHPVYIMYSSGTTGLPKCMVQGAGVLLNHLKELLLHTDLGSGERIFYFTTCGWMMWNWLVSSLGVGATLVLYDGNPFQPDPGALWKLAEREKVNVFGTSARYLAALEQEGFKPNQYDLTSLRALLSTGSPLADEGFDYVYRDIKKDVQLSSISGGTDLNGCFALGNPILPVYRGELQCRGLGMKVEVWNEKGESVLNEEGEMVCAAPFPSMPLHFWNDPNDERYLSAYFKRYPNIWLHGDYATINERGGMRIYGRSDATLNPGGVRMGTAEIYRVIEAIEGVEDSIVAGQAWQNDVRVILMVKLQEGKQLNDELEKQIRSEVRSRLSPRHVPARIFSVSDVPYTRNMKKVEIAVKNIVNKKPVTNRESLANPESLDEISALPGLFD